MTFVVSWVHSADCIIHNTIWELCVLLDHKRNQQIKSTPTSIHWNIYTLLAPFSPSHTKEKETGKKKRKEEEEPEEKKISHKGQYSRHSLSIIDSPINNS